MRRLRRFGFEAYLVGGGVRDLILGRKPKDFDVSTSATPVEIRKIFRNCRIIGRRFRLAHIFFGPKIIETSTFRAAPNSDEAALDGQELMIRRDNIFGSAEEDAVRRDFTINGLFYDLTESRVIDYVGGLEDLRAGRVRTIGDPRIRFQEDPVRILRAVKFAARLDFRIDPDVERAMVEFRSLIAKCSPARVLEEIYRLLGSGCSVETMRLLHRTGVLAVLFPEFQGLLPPPDDAAAASPVQPIRSGAGSLPSIPAEELPRDAEPENGSGAEVEAAPAEATAPGAEATPDPEPEPTREVELTVEQLLAELLGPTAEARDQAQRWMWGHLQALDELVRTPAPEPVTPSHSLLIGNLVYGLAARALDRELQPQQTGQLVDLLIQAFAGRLGVSRRDRERLAQVLQLQRRLIHPGRRTRPSALIKRDYFEEGLSLLALHVHATGEETQALERWQQLTGAGPAKAAGRRRRRRRRGRGRGQPVAQPQTA